jgi:predicted ArsR family transcriptional regulator
MELTSLQRRILEYLSEHDRVTIFELDKAMDVPREEFRGAYQQLHKLEFIAGLVGPRAGGAGSRWQLTSRGRNYIRAAHRTL